MKLNFIVTICFLMILAANCKAGDVDGKPFVLIDIGAGVRFVSLQSFNNALAQQGFPQLGDMARTGNMGIKFGKNKWEADAHIVAFWTNEKENMKISTFSAWGLSAGYGYKLWEKGIMCIYPYIQASYMVPQFNSSEQTDAASFNTVYEQPLTERTFRNKGEVDLALGLSYRIKTGKKYILGLRGSYNFRLFQGKWEYAENKVDYPSADLRGWEIGLFFNL